MTRVLMVGKWAKAHAFAKALNANDDVELHIYMDRPNAGILQESRTHRLGDMEDPGAVARFAEEVRPDLAVVVPQMSLSAGVPDRLEAMGVPTVGACQKAARLEEDKGFFRGLLEDLGLGHMSPAYRVFDDPDEAAAYIHDRGRDVAVKPVGVTSGDGVKVMGVQLRDAEEAAAYAREVFAENVGGTPRIIIEDRLRGDEFTLQAYVDGKTLVPMPLTRDYKLRDEGHRGPNTPGMGSYSEETHGLSFLPDGVQKQALTVMQRVIDGLREEHDAPYRGILAGQFLVAENGLKIIEFNVRPGDSEFLNITPIQETDMLRVCHAIAEGALHQVPVRFAPVATVCKYAVGPGFPKSKEPVSVQLDRAAIEDNGGHLFHSASHLGGHRYRPSPRLFAVTTTGESVEGATDRCEACLRHIEGDDLTHRRDIGHRERLEADAWIL